MLAFLRKPFATLLSLLVLLVSLGPHQVQAQACTPVSTLPCNQLQVSLPFALSFNAGVAGTLADKAGVGTGFTMVDAYSGTRLPQDGTPTNPNVPGYEPSKLTLSGGRLQLVSHKGIAFLTNNNQVNTLGVKVPSRGKLQIETIVVNPYNGSGSEQAGIWFGLSDKTFLKLAVSANKVGLRKETADASSTVSGTANPDQRITGTITGLDQKTVKLRLLVDGVANTAEGFYSVDGGTTYLSTGTAYSSPSVVIAGMGLSAGTAYAGIFATHYKGINPVTYSFDEFGVTSLSAPVFSSSGYAFSLADNAALNTVTGTVSASDANGDALTYAITGGNTNGTFSIDAATGTIKTAKALNHHTQSSYTLTVRASTLR